MNKVILMGRLTRDPEIRYANNENNTCIANYTLAVDRRFKRQGDEQTADFIRCVAMGKGGEFAEKYLHQGTKIVVEGRIQTGSYTNKDGRRFSLQRCGWNRRSLRRVRQRLRRMVIKMRLRQQDQMWHRMIAMDL